MSAEVKAFPLRRFARLQLDAPAPAPDNLIVLPVTRRDEACGAIAVPSFGDQARAVVELINVMREVVLPRMPLLDVGDAATLLHRLEAAAATLRGLAEKDAAS